MGTSFLTRGEIVTKVKNIAHDLGTTTDGLLDIWVNDIHRDIEQFWDFNWLESKGDITLKAGQELYVLPPNFRKFFDEYAVTLDGSELSYISESEWLNDYRSSPVQHGTPNYYRLYGPQVYVENQPLTESFVSVTSTSSSDTTQTAFIKGISKGIERFELVTLTGLVSAKTVYTYSLVSVISLSAAPTGVVRLFSDNEANRLLTLGPGQRSAAFLPFRVFPIPAAADNGKKVTLSFYTRIPDLMHDQDISIVPDQNVLIYGLLWMAYQHQNDTANADKFLLLLDNAKARLTEEDQLKYNKFDQVTPEYYSKRKI